MKLLIKAAVSILLLAYTFFIYKLGILATTVGTSPFILGSLYEFYRLSKKMGLKPIKWVGMISCVFLIFEAYMNNIEGMFHVILVALFLSFLTVVLDKNHLNTAIADTGITIFGLIYVGAMMSHLMLVCNFKPICKGMPGGMDFFMYIVLTNAIGDMCANGIGSWFGKTRFLPYISPNKTIVGTVGGILFSVISSVIIGLIINFPIYNAIMAGLCIGIAGIVGDFSESLIKRNAKVKDAGAIFVEHGGMLDRCDSLFFSSYFCYLYLKFFFFKV